MTEEEQVLLAKYRLQDGVPYGIRGRLNGVKMPNGYLATRVWIGKKCKRVLLHRLVFLLANGYLPKTVDHINRIRDDNRPENLRAASARDQQGNREAQGFTERTRRYARPRYEVSCDHRYVGVFDTAAEARAAYEKAKLKGFGDFAIGPG
jgi:hypothetical protein